MRRGYATRRYSLVPMVRCWTHTAASLPNAIGKRSRATRLQVRAKLLQRQPFGGTNVGRKSSWTEMALLSNEFGKQTRFTPVRSILARAGRSVQALMPCFMMSPLSLAKFIPAKALEFDLLVIDEASQMRPEDALGGMLRAKKIVVVGDQKQLPPTDFFSRSTEPGSEEEFEDIDDEINLGRMPKGLSGGSAAQMALS